jgi:hypothetical protein
MLPRYGATDLDPQNPVAPIRVREGGILAVIEPPSKANALNPPLSP